MSETRVDNVTVDIDKMLNSSPSTPSKPLMFRVGGHLRRIKPEAYDPQIIAIGPFHRCKPHLQKMEQHKVRYLWRVLKRRKEPSVERYVTAVRQFEDEARKCYTEDIGLDEDKFVKMLILDGFFIIEFLLKFQFRKDMDRDDPIFQYEHIQSQLFHDLMLFENQIPFSIVNVLFKMITNGDNINYIIWPLLRNSIFQVRAEDFPTGPINGHHLLGIVHDIIQCSSFAGSSSKKSEGEELKEAESSSKKSEGEELKEAGSSSKNWEGEELKEAGSSSKKSEGEELKEAGSSSKKSEGEELKGAGSSSKNSEGEELKGAGSSSKNSEGNQNHLVNINSAEELTEAGISFKKWEAKGLFDIEFENKVMKIPEWKIFDSTESLFRNLIAYEYYLTGSPQKLVTDYIFFMHCLVNSPEDAKLLRLSGIISNFLGGDEMVYHVINQLHKNIIISQKFSYYDIFDNVNDHCGHKWNRWMANLRRKYLYSPWASISVVAAIFLLMLTITQTIFAILSFCNDLKGN